MTVCKDGMNPLYVDGGAERALLKLLQLIFLKEGDCIFFKGESCYSTQYPYAKKQTDK